MSSRVLGDHTRSVLTVERLNVTYLTRDGAVPAVRDVSFTIGQGETFGLVGESGSGKSTIALAVMNYLGVNARVGGAVRYDGQDVLTLSAEELRRLRGAKIAMVYQDPMSSLNPSISVGDQIGEVLRLHQGISRREASQRAMEMMRRTQIPDPEINARRYPHQLSGGMQQRVVISMALISNPDLLILDEPTTGLDVTTEATILDLIADLRHQFQTAILFITHDLGVIAQVSTRIGVMYAGELVETGEAEQIFDRPQHPYTRALLSAAPKLAGTSNEARINPISRRDRGTGGMSKHPSVDDVLVNAADVKVHFGEQSFVEMITRRPPAPVRAVDGISLTLRRGETVGLVGESGSGKTTFGKALVRLYDPTSGTLTVGGEDLRRVSGQRDRELRKRVQFIFQNPESSLNPRKRVEDIIGRPLRLYGLVPDDRIPGRVAELLELVRLRPEHAARLPHELSGGEKQRVGIARAFAAEPDVVVADEPLSALDVSVQASILDLLIDLQDRFGTAYLFISHDLGTVQHLCNRVVVMYLGNIYEAGTVKDVFAPPYHPYTEALLSAIPIPDPRLSRERIRLEGPVPSPRRPPSGCKFHTRCPRKWGTICEQEPPPGQEVSASHIIYCHRPIDTLNNEIFAAAPRERGIDRGAART